jgi:hypothetical protein
MALAADANRPVLGSLDRARVSVLVVDRFDRAWPRSVVHCALCALGAGLALATVRTMPRLIVVGALLVAFQVAVFLFAAPQYGRPLAWTADSMLLNVTAPGLRQQQASLDAVLHAIRSQFDPAKTVVLTVTGQDPYRFMMYYLPEYRVLRLDPAAHSVLEARGQRQGTWSPREPADCLLEGGGVHRAVWVLSISSEPGVVPGDARLVANAGSGPFQVWSRDIGPATLDADYLGFKIGGHCVAG